MFLRLWPSEKLLYIPFESHHREAIRSKIVAVTSTTSEKTEKMALSQKSLAGPGYIVLNGIRVMNIIGFLAVITASVVMLAKTSTSTNLFFFDAVSHVITALTSMFLIASELNIFRSYFTRSWPLLSPSHGFVTLAIAMLVIGVDVMGNLNKDAGSRDHLGLAFWRIVIGSGILIFILGWLNLFASYTFRDRKQGITARQVRAHGAVAAHKTPSTQYHGTPPAPVLAQTYISNPSPITPTNKSSSKFRLPTFIERRNDSPILPSYHTASESGSPIKAAGSISPTSKYSRATNCHKKKFFDRNIFRSSRQSLAPPLPVNTSQPHEREMEISAPMGVNPQFAYLVQRPDSALHPSRTGESDPYRWRA